MKKLTIALVCMAVIGCVIPIASAGPLADYGDAPDNTIGQVFAYPGVEGQFPTLYATANSRIPARTGVHHLITSEEWLNETSAVSTTTTEIDALITDLDFDDSYGEVISYDTSAGPPYKSFAIIPVHVEASAPDTTRYLNVLIDQNRDGTWKNTESVTPEWAVVNKEINVTPGTTLISLPDFLLKTNESFWIRVTLTRSPIDESLFSSVGGWDGSAPSGGFAYGETEDYLITPSEDVKYVGKCIVKIIKAGYPNHICTICEKAGRTCWCQGVKNEWEDYVVTIKTWPGKAPILFIANVTLGPAWEVHGRGDVEIRKVGVLPPAWGGMGGLPQVYPDDNKKGVGLPVWQNVKIPVDPNGFCERGVANVIFDVRFINGKPGTHWNLDPKVRYDPDDVYVESDFIGAADIGWPEPMIESSDSSGNKKDKFKECHEVHVYGSGYVPEETYDLYIVKDRIWTDSMPIPPYIVKTTVSADANGDISPDPTLIWPSGVQGKYDIIVDVDGNGNYDEGIDALDDMDVNDAGFEVPSLTTIGLMALIGLLLVVTMSRIKRQ